MFDGVTPRRNAAYALQLLKSSAAGARRYQLREGCRPVNAPIAQSRVLALSADWSLVPRLRGIPEMRPALAPDR